MGRCRLYNISYTVDPASIAVPLERIPCSSWCGIQWQLVMVSSTGLLGSCSHCSAHYIMGADVLSTYYIAVGTSIASLHFPACSNGGNVVHVVSYRMNLNICMTHVEYCVSAATKTHSPHTTHAATVPPT